MSVNEKSDFSFEITEHIGVLTAFNNGWNKELNMVAWNNGAPKYDIRDWSENHENMSRGVTLYPKEVEALKDLLQDRDI